MLQPPAVLLLPPYKLHHHWSGGSPGGPVNSCLSGSSRAAAACSQMLLILPGSTLGRWTCSRLSCHSRGGHQNCKVQLQVRKRRNTDVLALSGCAVVAVSDVVALLLFP